MWHKFNITTVSSIFITQHTLNAVFGIVATTTVLPYLSSKGFQHLYNYSRARIIWSWPTISSRTSQHDDIIALTGTTMSLCCSIMILKVISYTSVQSVGPYNLTLSRPAVTSHHESSCSASGGKERLMSLVSWLTQTTNSMGRSHRTDREIPWGYHDIVAEFHTILRYKKFPRFEPEITGSLHVNVL